MDIRTSRRLVLAATLAGLVLRLLFGAVYWVGKPLTHDEREYLALAGSLRDGRGFTYPPDHEVGTAQRFSRAPGYPAFLALLIRDGDERAPAAPAQVKALQAVLGAAVVWLIGALAFRAAGPRAGAIAAWIAALYPPLVWLPAYVFSEVLYMPLALGSILVLDHARGRLDSTRSVREAGATVLVAGLMAGVAMLVRSGMLVFLPLAALWLVSRRAWSLALAFVIAAAVVVAPWTLRNVREHGRMILVAADGGVTFWTGNHPLATGEGDLAANPHLKREEIAFRRQFPGRTAEQLEPLYYRDAIGRMLESPGWWFGLTMKKLFYTFVPIGPSYTLHSAKYLVATVVPYLLLAPLAFIGVVRLVRRRAATPLLLLALSVVITGLVFFPQERFRIPVLDPTVIVAASCFLTDRVRARA